MRLLLVPGGRPRGKLMRKMFSLVALFALLDCMSSNADVIKRNEYLEYFYMTAAEQESQFKNRSIEEQYNLFLYGNQVIHPPAIYLARTFAQQGPQIIPFLRQKLESTRSELTIRDITAVLLEFARLKSYDFSKDANLMRLINQKVSGMHGNWKETTVQMASEIQSQN